MTPLTYLVIVHVAAVSLASAQADSVAALARASRQADSSAATVGARQQDSLAAIARRRLPDSAAAFASPPQQDSNAAAVKARQLDSLSAAARRYQQDSATAATTRMRDSLSAAAKRRKQDSLGTAAGRHDSTVTRAEIQKRDSVVVMRFGGDLLLAGSYETAARDSAGMAFEDFDLFRTDDLSIVNHECPITSRGKKVPKPYNFRMRPDFVRALPQAGIDLVNLANNHIYDYGDEGLFDTISYLDSVGVLHVGAGRDRQEARRPVVLRLKGRRIGFLGYYGGGEAPVAQATTCGVAPRNADVIADDVCMLRERDSVDYVVVLLHWGTEKADSPDEGQRAFAHRVIDAGADAIIGHHPHVLQGIERYKGGVIVYSLGNFVFGGNSRDTYNTALFEIRLGPGGTAFDVIPIGVRNWRVRVLDGTEGLRVRESVETLSSGFPNSIFTMKEKP